MFGADEGTPLSADKAVPPVLTVHWTVIHCRLPFESTTYINKTSPTLKSRAYFVGADEGTRTHMNRFTGT